MNQLNGGQVSGYFIQNVGGAIATSRRSAPGFLRDRLLVVATGLLLSAEVDSVKALGEIAVYSWVALTVTRGLLVTPNASALASALGALALWWAGVDSVFLVGTAALCEAALTRTRLSSPVGVLVSSILALELASSPYVAGALIGASGVPCLVPRAGLESGPGVALSAFALTFGLYCALTARLKWKVIGVAGVVALLLFSYLRSDYWALVSICLLVPIPTWQCELPAKHAAVVCAVTFSLWSAVSSMQAAWPAGEQALVVSKCSRADFYSNVDQRGAEFGLFLSYLQGSGDSPNAVQVLEPGAPVVFRDGLKAVVIVNPSFTWSRELSEKGTEFLMNGGRLLVLADHTNLGQQADHINPFLIRHGVQLEYDSAIPVGPSWSWSERLVSSGALRHWARPNMSIGCSLALSRDAEPVLFGRGAFSDEWSPERNDDNFFGGGRQGQDEPTKTLILGAHVRVGQGELLVLGDTSPIQDSALLEGAPFVEDCVAWLRGRPRSLLELQHLLLLGIAALSLTVRNRALWLLSTTSLVAAGALRIFSESTPNVENVAGFVSYTGTPLSHAESSVATLKPLTDLVLESGYWPANRHQLETLRVLLVGQSDRVRLDRELDRLRPGGTLLIVVQGGAHRIASRSSPIEGVQLSPNLVEGELETALGDLSRAIGLELLADADWTTIATVAGFPVAVERVVIGDKRVVLTSMASSFVGPGLERERSVQRVDTLRTLRVLGVLE